LRQLQRLLRCAFCQGTYLGFNATPCIHLHLTQRTLRDLISASLEPRFYPPRPVAGATMVPLVLPLLGFGAYELCSA